MKRIDQVPFRREWDVVRQRLNDEEFAGMVARINELIDDAGAEIATAGWLPGSDWTGTPFEPIYTKGTRRDYDRSAMFFGQLVWQTIMERPEAWGSGRYELDGKQIGSRTYFRLTKVDPSEYQ